jgi:hypothetical protein
MLVATTLVVMMLILFAQIFGDTVRIMRNQQALSQNDQKARHVDSVIRTDLEKATFRQVRDKGVYGITPLRANWPVDAERQRGYLYISENNPRDPTDDVLQLTIDMRLTHRNSIQTPLSGRAASINSGSNPNEPENDDGITGNGIGESPAAEVSYFLRGGNLYRRVLLLRKPIVPSSTSAPAEFPVQPGSGVDGGTLIFTKPTTPVYAQFWNDFDYSAWNRQIDTNGDNTPDAYQIMFNGLDSLQNVVGATSYPIALPYFRYGHVPLRVTGAIVNAGRPMEYVYDSPGGAANYVGRFVHEETSHSAFEWPGGFSNNNPYYGTYNSPVDSTPSDYILDVYQGGSPGPRAGEDLLLSGVESFDLEVWDDGFRQENGSGGMTQVLPGQWRDLGHDTTNTATGAVTNLGWFKQDNTLDPKNPTQGNGNQGYGPNNTPAQNRVFDTWHPSNRLGTTLPPFSPVFISLPLQAGSQYTAYGYQQRSSISSVNTNTVYFPRVADATAFNRTNATSGDDDSYYYRVIYPTSGSGSVGSRAPEWPREPGATVVDGGVIWQCYDNRIGLQAVRITIRFRDPGNGSPRQVSVIHSFVE